jgi:hypothetical protein
MAEIFALVALKMGFWPDGESAAQNPMGRSVPTGKFKHSTGLSGDICEADEDELRSGAEIWRVMAKVKTIAKSRRSASVIRIVFFKSWNTDASCE